MFKFYLSANRKGNLFIHWAIGSNVLFMLSSSEGYLSEVVEERVGYFYIAFNDKVLLYLG